MSESRPAKPKPDRLIPGWQAGHRIDPTTQKPELREYSALLREAEDLMVQIAALTDIINEKEREIIPGRLNEDSNTLSEMRQELRELEVALKNKLRQRKITIGTREAAAQLRHKIWLYERRLGISRMRQEIDALRKQVRLLIETDDAEDRGLRNLETGELPEA